MHNGFEEVPDRLTKIRAMTAAVLMVGAGIGILSGLSGIFIKAVCADTGLSRASFSLIGSIATLVSAFTAPFASRVLSGKRLRTAVAVGAVMCGSAPVLYSLSSAVWQFWLTAAFNGLFLNFVTMLSAGILLSRSFPSGSTAAAGIAFAAAGLFTSVATPLVWSVIAAFGWRMAWAMTGIAAAVILLMAASLIPKAVSEAEASKSNTALTPNKKACFAAEAAVFAVNFCNLAMFNHAMAFLTDIGYGTRAASVIAWATAFMVAARIGMGFVYSHLGTHIGTRILSLSVFVCALCALDLPNSRTLTIYIFALAFSSTASALPAKALATSDDGTLDNVRFARLTKLSSLGSALGPPAAGAVFDITKSYRTMWQICLFMAALSLWLFAFSIRKTER